MELPMENRYLLPKYFVRQSYSEYYELVLEKLARYHIVTDSGTSGIGTSFFYGNFFEHYKWKPKVTIITASFTIESRMQEDVVFRADGSVERSSRESHKVMDAARKAALERKDEVLYLYDGPPDFDPPFPFKMVCFASPNETWLRMVSKKQEPCALYMPLWDVEELVAAATRLQLEPEVAEEQIEERFAIFGGVARGCLTKDEKFVSKRIQDLMGDINGTDSLNVLERLTHRGRVGPTQYRMCHFQPKPSDPKSFDVQVASKFVSLRLLEKISSRLYENRGALLQYLEGIPKREALHGYLGARASAKDSVGPSRGSESVKIIPKIGDEKTEALGRIKTSDFRRDIPGPRQHLFGSGTLKQCASDLEKFEERQEQTKQMLVSMPQYVWLV
ncbi:hypothetical protein PHYPSEUDO_006883 [Phytophthora pseudosyringae]|uniref:Uncharacterized protein n=1 Tax=Phytophthora pseudosyringae TaxID=221518 RepID=A0A8T1WEL1_9STRA|nr:hypothetical protein PHYPSEUDO_006883 [Phytophthora pseudosyringae]